MQTLETRRKDIINFFLKKGLLVSNELLKHLDNGKNLLEISKLIEDESFNNIAVMSDKIKDFMGSKQQLDWLELEKLKAVSEKKGQATSGSYEQILKYAEGGSEEKKDTEGRVKIVCSYNGAPKKREAADFIQ